jgi:hypothetical protein
MSNERPERDNDPLVSASYRDLADERTPQRLDDTVLAEARAAAKPGYGRIRLWTRPLAWAATIAISLAIVLQLTRVPEPELLAPGVIEQRVDAEPPQRDEADAAGRLASDAPASADEFIPEDVHMLREVEGMARSRSAPGEEAAAPVPASASFTLEKTSAAQYCDDDARATPESWLECIERLEAEGREAEADAERLVFKETHPDY